GVDPNKTAIRNNQLIDLIPRQLAQLGQGLAQGCECIFLRVTTPDKARQFASLHGFAAAKGERRQQQLQIFSWQIQHLLPGIDQGKGPHQLQIETCLRLGTGEAVANIHFFTTIFHTLKEAVDSSGESTIFIYTNTFLFKIMLFDGPRSDGNAIILKFRRNSAINWMSGTARQIPGLSLWDAIS